MGRSTAPQPRSRTTRCEHRLAHLRLWKLAPSYRFIVQGATTGSVTSNDGRRDAKSVRIDEDGYIVLARRNAEPFDPEKVDRLMRLHLSASTGYRVDLTNGTAELAASATILDAWDVPVAAPNQAMPEHGDDDPNWRNVLLDPADLTEYKVS